MDKRHYREDVIKSIEIEELYHRLYKFLDVDEEAFYLLGISSGKIPKGLYLRPIEIDLLIKKLKYLKKEGANFVSINQHIDHGSYILDGLSIENFKLAELQKLNKKAQERRNKLIDNKIKELERNIQKLKDGKNV